MTQSTRSARTVGEGLPPRKTWKRLGSPPCDTPTALGSHPITSIWGRHCQWRSLPPHSRPSREEKRRRVGPHGAPAVAWARAALAAGDSCAAGGTRDARLRCGMAHRGGVRLYLAPQLDVLRLDGSAMFGAQYEADQILEHHAPVTRDSHSVYGMTRLHHCQARSGRSDRCGSRIDRSIANLMVGGAGWHVLLVATRTLV